MNDDTGTTDSQPPQPDEEAHRVQGEGDYDAARRYDKAAREFAESGKVEEAAHDAQPESADVAVDLKQAEEEGKSHAKGEDPLLNRAVDKPAR
jgi:hypothetical protein